MRFQLEPLTPAGREFARLGEQHAEEVAARADEHDRDGTFPHEAIAAMKESGFLRAPVPERFGGMGLESPHDLMVGTNRLGRGDGSIAIAANMHLATCMIVSRFHRAREEAGDAEGVAAMEGFLTLLGSGAIAMANVTEPGTDFVHPMTEVTRVDDGWRLDGRKTFGTLSEVADVMPVSARRKRDDGAYSIGRAIVFRGAPGQTILDNWDALGMRASGSHDIVYENCIIPPELWLEGVDWGAFDEDATLTATVGNIGLLGVFLGIAEAAREHVVAVLKKRTKQPSGATLATFPGIQHAMAELEIDAATARAHLSWIGRQIDAVVIGRPVADVGIGELLELAAAFQCAKVVVNRKAIDVVDKALQLSGGAGYMRASPLARLYRDVRAGPFMQPFSPNEAYGFIGKIALDQPLDP